ncbi:DUF5958 family protein [Spirosoma linguale]|uniref:Uncharacterized protein n=1 Tax=Spirosoma linguale (strain ATCC 33905 / DSM 74 / LMG 10896 / Claus 1) TaxID=504472 RepID=D2QQW8_SPILD|nr:hypothetical protein Slin_1775 [Spirosoma linguale DSM 74]
MSLDEEIAICQFGQGISSINELQSHFTQLNHELKKIYLYELYDLIRQLNPLKVDLDLALADSPLDATYTPSVNLKSGWLNLERSTLTKPEEERNFIFLLYLYRTTYRRNYTLNQENATTWQYQDLSKPDVVQNILTTHHNLLEAIYNNPSYRTEFLSLAKLWHDQFNFRAPNQPEPTASHANQFHFLDYDELITASLNMFSLKTMRSSLLLRHSLEKALSIQYKIDLQQARQLVIEITRRHLQEKDNSTPNY